MFKLKYLLLLISVAFSLSLYSQDEKKEETPEEKVIAPKIKLIPTQELTSRIPDATNKVKKIRNSLISSDELNLKKAKLDTFLIKLKKFEREHTALSKKLTDESRLQYELYQWVKQKDRLTQLQHEFNAINNELLSDKEKLAELKIIWEKSIEAAKKDNLPRNAKKIVTTFIKGIDKVALLVNEKSYFVYTQLERITNRTIFINDYIQLIENKLDNLTELLLFTKEPSLFRTLFSKDTTQTQRTYTTKELFIPIAQYMSDNVMIVVIHFIFLFILIVLMTIVKKRIKPDKYKDINPRLLHTVFEVLSRPLSTSFLIFLLSANMVYTDAPPVLITLIFFLLLIPVMIILPLITIRQLNFYIYGLGVVYLLTLFLRLHLLDPGIQYLIILGAIIMSLLGINKFLKKNIIIRIFHRKPAKNFISLLFYIFSVFLVVAFFSIIIGYYTLGIFLFDNTIWSIYRFFLFYAAYVILDGFNEFMLNSDQVLKIKSIKKNKDEILSWVNTAIRLILVYYFLKEVFSLFRVEDQVKEFLISLWDFKISPGQLEFTLGNIFTLIITLWISNLLSKIISSVLEQDILKKFKFKRGIPKTISTLAKYAVLTIGFLIAVAAAGMELQSFTIILGALGVGIGFGLQDIINNFISGLILLFERPIQVGDTVQVDQLWGKVKSIGIRSSVIRAFDGSEVIVPNSMLISREVTNWTLSDQRRRLEIEVGVEYGTDLSKVLKILIDSAKKHKSVMEDPAPAAWFTGFGDSSINFKLVFWHPEFDGSLALKSEVAISVFDAFEKEGITIPFPQQDVYIKENVTGTTVTDDKKDKEEKDQKTDEKKSPVKEKSPAPTVKTDPKTKGTSKK